MPIRLTAKDLEGMLNKEFFLTAFGKASGDLRARCAGMLGEVVSRQAHDIRFYELGELRHVLREDGTAVDIDDVLQSYIYTIDRVEEGKRGIPILHGSAAPYELHTDTLGPAQRLAAYFAFMPQKEDDPTGICCL